MFDDTFFDQLPADPILAAHRICEAFCAFDCNIPDKDKQGFLEHYLTALGAFQAFADAYVLNFDFPELSGDREKNTREIRQFFITLRDALDAEVAKLTVEQAKHRFTGRFAPASYFEFSDENLKKLRLLFTSIRYEVERLTGLREEMRWRLLRKLENSECKLQKRLPDLDRLWGFMGEARVILGTTDEDTKLILDRINEIARITRITQAHLVTSGAPGTANDKR